MSGRLRGQRVLVLGGSSGIGLAVAREALREDAEVMIVSSQMARIEQALAVLGHKAQGCTLDLRDERAIERFFNGIGEFDHLVYTAGDTLQLGALRDTGVAAAHPAFDLRYWGALATARHGVRNVRAGGSITFTTGIAAQRPRAGWALAASVCGAVEALTRALAVELAPIRVNAVSPGLVATKLWTDMTDTDRQRMFADAGDMLPVGRVGSAEDIAAAYVFLMTSGFATGQTHVVDGGALLV
ncbi:SDR family oxidoreductase [Duganella sp. CY15W]|uniref:SDR family oxidoreductase n=1 Tax=Duganella sp. CY15W TaxID=2692172 RepID=UPI001371488E|nr:SDR family oxidoreductase [Duganella sp. CY15W]MYM27266.1 SDR family oxidoreductase [Duganella sp. CY15W]